VRIGKEGRGIVDNRKKERRIGEGRIGVERDEGG